MPRIATAASKTSGPGANPPVLARGWVYLFLFSATFLSILDRQTVNIAAPLIQKDLGINNEQLGRLFSAFLVTYAVGHLAVGFIIDRLHYRLAYGTGVALWSLAGALTGLAQGFGQLFGLRSILGFFEAVNLPAAARMIQRMTARSERAFANGILNSGSCLASLVAPLVMISLFNAVGWRLGFVLIGSLGFIWCILWFSFTRNRELPPPPIAPVTSQPEREVPWRLILAAPRFYGILFASVCANSILHFSTHWITAYMVQNHHQAFGSKLSLLLAFIYLGMDAGYLGGGALVMFLAGRGVGTAKARRVVMLVATSLMCLAVAIPHFRNVGIVAGLLCLLNIGRGAWGTVFLTYTQEICPRKVATLTALSGCAGALGGAVFVSFVGYAWDRGWQQLPFLILGALPILASASLFLTHDIKSPAGASPAGAARTLPP